MPRVTVVAQHDAGLELYWIAKGGVELVLEYEEEEELEAEGEASPAAAVGGTLTQQSFSVADALEHARAGASTLDPQVSGQSRIMTEANVRALDSLAGRRRGSISGARRVSISKRPARVSAAPTETLSKTFSGTGFRPAAAGDAAGHSPAGNGGSLRAVPGSMHAGSAGGSVHGAAAAADATAGGSISVPAAAATAAAAWGPGAGGSIHAAAPPRQGPAAGHAAAATAAAAAATTVQAGRAAPTSTSTSPIRLSLQAAGPPGRVSAPFRSGASGGWGAAAAGNSVPIATPAGEEDLLRRAMSHQHWRRKDRRASAVSTRRSSDAKLEDAVPAEADDDDEGASDVSSSGSDEMCVRGYLGEGECFGEVPFLFSLLQPCSVRTTRLSRLLFLRRESWGKIAEDHPTVREKAHPHSAPCTVAAQTRFERSSALAN